MSSLNAVPVRERYLFCWLVSLNVLVFVELFFSNYMNRDKNYGIRPDQYAIRTISESEYQLLPQNQQLDWARDGGSAIYIQVTIKNSFVSRHSELISVLPISLIALILSWLSLRSRSLDDHPPKTSSQLAVDQADELVDARETSAQSGLTSLSSSRSP